MMGVGGDARKEPKPEGRVWYLSPLGRGNDAAPCFAPPVHVPTRLSAGAVTIAVQVISRALRHGGVLPATLMHSTSYALPSLPSLHLPQVRAANDKCQQLRMDDLMSNWRAAADKSSAAEEGAADGEAAGSSGDEEAGAVSHSPAPMARSVRSPAVRTCSTAGLGPCVFANA